MGHSFGDVGDFQRNSGKQVPAGGKQTLEDSTGKCSKATKMEEAGDDQGKMWELWGSWARTSGEQHEKHTPRSAKKVEKTGIQVLETNLNLGNGLREKRLSETRPGKQVGTQTRDRNWGAT